MHSVHLNEHDANQGAQSSGEFLGMTGNSGWYLLGSGGATILMVIFLWGVFGMSLLICLLAGALLCGLSLTYVFALKNNKPRHYDSDFFESALVEAGVLQLRFGPRECPPANPFDYAGPDPSLEMKEANRPSGQSMQAALRDPVGTARPLAMTSADPAGGNAKPAGVRQKAEPVVARADYEQIQEQLVTAEEMLEDALAERGEE